MAKDKLEDWDEVAASNLDMGGISLAENVMRPPAVNNEMREHMAQVAKWLGDDTIVAASSTDLGSLPARYIAITGNTAITSFGTIKAGTVKYLKFTGTPTITYNVASLILPTSANIVAAAGDTAVFVSEGAGNWRCMFYSRASGLPLPSFATKVDTRRNRVVNGDKLVSQENGQTAGATNGRYISDQNAMYFVSSAGVFTGLNVLTLSPAGGYRDRITITTADASLAAGEYLTYTQNIEGSNIRDAKWGTAGAVPIIVRRGFKFPAGTYTVAFHNSAVSRSYVTSFVVSGGEANTDIVREFAIPGDTTGTWLSADGVIGLTMDVVIAAGTTFQTTANAWQAGNFLTIAGTTNGIGTASAVFEFFDEGLKLDPDATGVYGVYQAGEVDEIYRAARYAERGQYYWVGGAISGYTHGGWTTFKTQKCKTPLVQQTNTANSAFSATPAQQDASPTGYGVRRDAIGDANGSYSETYLALARLS